MAEAADLLLVCSNDIVVQASSSQLMNSSHSIAFKEMVLQAQKEQREGEPARLQAPGDVADAWKTCIALLKDAATQDLTWETLLPVLKLADKYEVRTVQNICQERVVSHTLENVQEGPFQRAKLQGKQPWELLSIHQVNRGAHLYHPQILANVAACVDTAIHLHTVGLIPAYTAFVFAWFASVRKQSKLAKECGYEKSFVPVYNLVIDEVGKLIENGTACMVRQRLYHDFMAGIAKADK